MVDQRVTRLARIAGTVFLAAILCGVTAEFALHGTPRTVLRLVALVCYLAVTILFYLLFRRVDALAAAGAAVLSVILLIIAPLRWHPAGIDVGLVCFGLSCLVTAYLVHHSGFLPRALAILCGIAGLAWLSFISQSLSRSVYPYNLAVAAIGQIGFALWLAVLGTRKPRLRALEGA
jgi:Domain of unknown function (DUF4386)